MQGAVAVESSPGPVHPLRDGRDAAGAAALQGANKVVFTGRIGRRALAPSSYRATVTAKDAAGNVSKPSTASFTIAAR